VRQKKKLFLFNIVHIFFCNHYVRKREEERWTSPSTSSTSTSYSTTK